MGVRYILAGAIVGLSFISNADAAQRQALIGTYYESYSGPFICNAAGSCVAHFLATPADKNILINDVSCLSASAYAPDFVAFGPQTAINVFPLIKYTYLKMSSSKLDGSTFYSTFDTSHQMIIGAGRFPAAVFQASTVGNITLDCSLSGTVIP